MGRQVAIKQALLPEDGSQELQSVCTERRTPSFLQRKNKAVSCIGNDCAIAVGLHTQC